MHQRNADFLYLPDRHDPAAARVAWSTPHYGEIADDVRERLERLDDAMFAAIDGCREALRRAESLWDDAASSLDWRLIEESREQYLRYAVDVTRRFEFDPQASAERMLLALDVIAMLTKC
ncbi:MAG: hypothetical protein KDA44_17555 [Planctomycetales bacterium]|nr:hypothetical protein [Planctomycetales bacterium]